MINETQLSQLAKPHVDATLQQFLILINTPLQNPDMWWIIAPLIATFLVTTFYFGVYRVEEIGWNTALVNSVVLLFIVIDQLRHIFNYTNPGSIGNFFANPMMVIFIGALIFESLLIFFITSTHALPKRIMFLIASPTSINSQAFVLIAIVYAKIEPTWYLLTAGLLLIACLILVSGLIHFIQYLCMLGEHKDLLKDARELRSEARNLRKKARSASDKKASSLKNRAQKKVEKAREYENEVRHEELERFGRLLPFAKHKIKKKRS